MKIWSEFLEVAGVAESFLKGRRYTVTENGAVLVEGQDGVLGVGDSEVKFRYGKRVLSVKGENLKIKTLSKGFAVVCGTISGVDET